MVLAMAAFAIEDAFFKFATTEVPVGPALAMFGLIGLAIFIGLSRAHAEPVLHPETDAYALGL